MPDPTNPAAPQDRPRRPSIPRLPRREAPGEPVVVDSRKLKKLQDEHKALVAQLKETMAERDDLRTRFDDLAPRADELQAKVDEYIGALQRERAEFTNYKRRVADEREAARGLAAEILVTKILGLADDFDRAIENRPAALEGDAWADGIAAIDRKLRALIESEGVTPIEAGPGTAFDPREHEAVTTVPGTGRPENEIVGEIRRGYRLGNRVIRPSLVAVAAAPDDAPAAPAN